ncbi:hypothetical protein JOF40_001168 [Aeromicrobium fastidiosum]|nr:hypothetical protein [Aeromicrobium fastidiosum]
MGTLDRCNPVEGFFVGTLVVAVAGGLDSAVPSEVNDVQGIWGSCTRATDEADATTQAPCEVVGQDLVEVLGWIL